MFQFKKTWRFLPSLLFVLLGLIFWRGLFLHPQQLPSMKIGQTLSTFNLPALGGGEFNSSRLMKKQGYALLNVWASWCDSCAQEQAFMMTLAHQGIPIFGLNYKDEPEQAKNWLKAWGNPYRAIGIDINGEVAIELGVYGTPETFLIGPTGKILYRHPGLLTAEIWTTYFEPKMKG
jgi:cytochrome c biogenesis protein CcmG, thiol:disulfide interchange protein DsbE